MSFLYPAFLLGALAIAIPVVLHLLRRDIAPEVPFSAVRLLRRSPIEQSKRRRLRDLLLLAARAAALLLLAASFARPYISGGPSAAELHIVAIDRSFSMGAPGRVEQARDVARAIIRDAGLKDRVAVVAFDDRADVVAQPGNRGDALAAIDAVEPGFGATRYAPALRKAIQVADGAPARLSLITDLQRTGWEDEQPMMVPSSLRLDFRDVGAPPSNLAIAAIRLERGRAVASLRNSGAARAARVTAAIDGRHIGEVPFKAAANSSSDVTIPLRDTTGVLTLTVDDPSGMPADNSRHAILDAAKRPEVLLVGDSRGRGHGFYLSRALAAGAEEDDGFDARLMDGKALAVMPDVQLTSHAGIVLLSTRGLDRRARETLAGWVRGGGGLLIVAAGDVETTVLSGMFGWEPALEAVEHAAGGVLSATDVRHPIFRPFGVLAANLGQVQFSRVWRVQEDGWDVMARFTDGTPALLERREGQGRVVLFTSDLDRRWNDFPLHPAFVPFAVESVRYVTGARERVREYLVTQAPEGVRPQPGAIQLPPDNRTVVLNVDSRESNPARLTSAEFEGMLERVEATPPALAASRGQQEEGRQSYWQFGLLLMIAVLVVESVIGKV